MAHGSCCECHGLACPFVRNEPMENLWGIHFSDVYANGRQFDHGDNLQEGILAAWDQIFPNLETFGFINAASPIDPGGEARM